MSYSSSGFTDPQQQHGAGAQAQQNPALTPGYIPTEDEKRVFSECNQESFMYRSLPFSVVAVSLTQVLVSRGILTPSPRFGSLPKLAFAGLIGYVGGKISYAKICQEKFKNLENSPLGEALRQGRQLPQQFAPQSQSEMGDPGQAAFDPTPQPVMEPASDFSYSSNSSFSDSSSSTYQPSPFSDSAPMAASDDAINPQEASYLDDDAPKRKQILYENLRSKNRENYEVMMTQKADTLLQPPGDAGAPQRDVKKNKYGDAWDE